MTDNTKEDFRLENNFKGAFIQAIMSNKLSKNCRSLLTKTI